MITTKSTLQIVNVGGRMIPVGHLRIGEQVIAYNPHLHPISKEGGNSEIVSEEELSVRVTPYYLGCFQRGALYALQPKQEVPLENTFLSQEQTLHSEQNVPLSEARATRKKKDDLNRGDEPPGSFSHLSTKEKP